MAEHRAPRIWLNRGLFLLAAYGIVVAQFVPLDLRPQNWAWPDILLAMTLAWVARKPNYAPVTLIALVFLMTDLLLHRPPGLWTALVVILTETLRRQNSDLRSMPVLLEWGTISFGIVAITVMNRLITAVVMVPQPPLGLTLIQMISTIAIYPLVVIIGHFVFGVRRAAPGQTGSRGQKI